MSRRQFFWFFLFFNLLFFSVQLSFVYLKNNSFIHAMKLPINIYLQLIATLVIHIGLYSLLSLIQTLMLLGVIKRKWIYFSTEQWQITIWLLSVITLFSANSYYFPLSTFSILLSIPSNLALILFGSSLSALCFLLINSIRYCNRLGLLILLVSFASAMLLLNHHSIYQKSQIQHSKPNVIILGIDSLSPESINTFNMPFLSSLVKKSTQFTNSISPLARTYPAWSSILTGLYAKHHHAEENLMAKNKVDSHASIAWHLAEKGYNTIFATDDRRFNSIDTDFGFKKIIGPKLGVNDILLGSFNDFPLSNLLINTPISSWLFPYNYINRASFFSYYPATFSEHLHYVLSKEERNKPLFLAVHFTLPHWPYAWAESSKKQLDNEFSLERRNSLYQEALHKVDGQFHTFFNYLTVNDYFNDSLVIILSDHGEALYYAGSRLTNYKNYQERLPSRLDKYFKLKTATQLDKSAGHGSDILSPKQYHNLLAFAIYKKGLLITSENKITTRVALIDLAPTILEFLGMTMQHKQDGISLLPAIVNSGFILPARRFFIESGMCPNQSFSREKTVALGKLFYWVNPENNELEIKPEALKRVRDQKLYGVIEGDWIMALYPDDKTYIPIIQNLITGQWSDDFYSDFSQSTPAHHLFQYLKKFYGKNLFLPLPEPPKEASADST